MVSEDAHPVAAYTADDAPDDANVIHLGSIDLRGVTARLEFPEGEPTMVVADGDCQVEFVSGMGKKSQAAINGAREIASVALAMIEELSRKPHPESSQGKGSG